MLTVPLFNLNLEIFNRYYTTLALKNIFHLKSS